MKIDLADLAIETAEELQRLKLKKATNLKSTRELSKLIKKDFTWRLDYAVRFSEAYYWTYSVNLSGLTTEERKPYMGTIVEKLESPSNLENERLTNLIAFCSNLATSFDLYNKEKFARGPCFLVA